ncbi:hypothetical protein ACTZVT_27865, partial [Klebsiella pneumoniae]|uniref:hypothetical protein n=1 Tax=Klebsiella pneumoniae TaxID=573 RepID=UPI001963D939
EITPSASQSAAQAAHRDRAYVWPWRSDGSGGKNGFAGRGIITAKAVTLFKSSRFALRGFRRVAPPMRSAHLLNCRICMKYM